MSERAEQFLALSSVLTGFNRVELLGTGMADAYLRAVEDGVPGDVLDRLLASGDDAAIMGDEALAPAARDIIVLWYTGAWQHTVVSGDAYVAGLQWVAAGAHPAGARAQGYGAWAVPPDEVDA